MKTGVDEVDIPGTANGGLRMADKMKDAKTKLRFFGMRRSGNHAVVSWMISNISASSYTFFNNCKPWQNPLETYAEVEIDGDLFPRRSKLRGYSLDFLAGKRWPSKLLVVSYEDIIPPNHKGLRKISGNSDLEEFDQNILVVRSFLNWLASLHGLVCRSGVYSFRSDLDRYSFILQCISIYREILILVSEKENHPEIEVVDFDLWASSTVYRSTLMSKIGFHDKQRQWDYVPPYGRGSSFETPNTPGSNLRVHERWKEISRVPALVELVRFTLRFEAFTDVLAKVYPCDLERAKVIL